LSSSPRAVARRGTGRLQRRAWIHPSRAARSLCSVAQAIDILLDVAKTFDRLSAKRSSKPANDIWRNHQRERGFVATVERLRQPLSTATELRGDAGPDLAVRRWVSSAPLQYARALLGQDRAESISRRGRHLGSGLALLADRLDQHFWRFWLDSAEEPQLHGTGGSRSDQAKQ
jgi:hypothetical protein